MAPQSHSEQSISSGSLPATLESVKAALSGVLQTSLDLQETLAAFFKAIQQVVACNGLLYVFEHKKINIRIGNQSRHNAIYHLHANDVQLGDVQLFRTTQFSKEELHLVESMLGLLIYPLRNALLYREALENSLRDSLTQVGNRAALELALKRELQLSERNGDPLSLLVIDIDHFKRVNDSAGHAFGDKIICSVAATITYALRQTDQVFRFGGEEFVVLLNNTSHSAALCIAERIRRCVMALAFEHKGQEFAVTVSAGVSTNIAEDTRDNLVQRADDALYAAKHQGRNQVVSQADIGFELAEVANQQNH